MTPPPAVCQLGSDWISQKQTLRWRFGHRNLGFVLFFFFLEERVPLGSIPVRQERKQDWSEGEAGMPCSNPRAPAHPMGTSGAAMPLQSGPELGEEGLSLRMSLSC